MKTKSLLVSCLLLGVSSAYAAAGSSKVGDGGNTSNTENQKIYSKNPEANALYIQGLEYLNKSDARDGGSLPDAEKAYELFQQAARKDPKFALAYLGQSNALDNFSFSVPGSMPAGSVYRRQEAAALRAAQLDDSLADAHEQLAEIYDNNEYEWRKAEKELKRVIELTSNDVMAYTHYGLFLAKMGRFKEAEAQIELARTIDDKSAAPNSAMLRIFYWEHKYDAAAAQGLEALKKREHRPDHYFLAFVYIHQGQFEKGIEEMKLASFGDADSLAGLAYAYAMAGDKIQFANTLEQFQHHPAHAYTSYGLAEVYAAVGDKGRAINLIEQDYRRRSSRLDTLKVDPAMDPLRQEAQFKQLMHKMHFE
jgi:tetratricopeptide (TPR) repeat protein